MMTILLYLALTVNALFAVVFAPRVYRVLRDDYLPIYRRWWRMVGRRKVLYTLRGIGFSVLVIMVWLFFSIVL